LSPNVETLGYYQTSLRDEDEILVALGFPTCCVADFELAGVVNFAALADWKSAIQQTGSLRYRLDPPMIRVTTTPQAGPQ
jgi:hypothetical protein